MTGVEGVDSRDSPLVARLHRLCETVWRLVVTTVRSCLQYRVTGLAAEINVLRYRHVPVTVRCEDTGSEAVLREASATLAVQGQASFSFRDTPAPALADVLVKAGFAVSAAPDEEFDKTVSGRVRHLGTRDLQVALGGTIDVTVYAGPSLPASRVALLPYVHEQAVSITNHRFGHPTPLTAGLQL